MGTDSALEKQLLRIRYEVIGTTPRSRNHINPRKFFEDIYGPENGVVVGDSNELGDDWRTELNKENPSSDYMWSNLTENLRNMEEIEEDEEEVENDDENDAEMDPVDRPKRVFIYTSKKNLTLLSRGKKSSLDGTFKSAPKLFGQQFIWMVKNRGYWTPVVWGLLPDKSETSYKCFLLLVKKKMEELKLELNVKSVICDFELNIIKSVDDMLGVPIHGCYFHFKKCFMRRVDKNGMKTVYEKNEQFRKLINDCSALSFLPIEDIEEGLQHIDRKFTFTDEKLMDFKQEFLDYIKTFWIHGCLPHYCVSCTSKRYYWEATVLHFRRM